MSRSLIVALLTAQIALTACGNVSSDDRTDAMETPGLIEIGTGNTAWEPLSTGQPLELIAGPQGGHHFIVHARIRDMEPGDPARPGLMDNPVTRFRAYATDDGREVSVDVPPYRLGYEDGGDGYFYLVSGRLLVINEADVDSLYGNSVRLTVYAADAANTASRDETVIMAVAPNMVR